MERPQHNTEKSQEVLSKVPVKFPMRSQGDLVKFPERPQRDPIEFPKELPIVVAKISGPLSFGRCKCRVDGAMHKQHAYAHLIHGCLLMDATLHDVIVTVCDQELLTALTQGTDVVWKEPDHTLHTGSLPGSGTDPGSLKAAAGGRAC